MKRGFLNSSKAKRQLTASTGNQSLASKSDSPSSDSVSLNMKRGFLNSSKAKRQLTASTGNQNFASKSDLPSDSVSLSGSVEVSYSAVPDTGLTLVNDISSLNPLHYVYTQVPAVPAGTKLEDFPGGWTECNVSIDVKREIFSAPDFPKPPVSPTGDSKSYRISSAGTKGLGMFATRLIRAGNLIIDERPLLVVPTFSNPNTMKGVLSTAQRLQISLLEWGNKIKVAFDRMPEENQKAFMKLFNNHKYDGSSEIVGLVRTNGIEAGDLKDNVTADLAASYCAVCKEISRINHSCCPNALYTWSPDSFSFRIYALRDIPADAEITIQYCDVLDSAANRAANLAPYGITSCACSPSCRDPALSKISDERRERFRRELTVAVSPPLMGPKSGEAEDAWIAPVLERLTELEEEQLETTENYRKTLQQLFNIYAYLQDVDKALVYTRKLFLACKVRRMDNMCPSKLLTKEGIKETQQLIMDMQKKLAKKMPPGAGLPVPTFK